MCVHVCLPSTAALVWGHQQIHTWNLGEVNTICASLCHTYATSSAPCIQQMERVRLPICKSRLLAAYVSLQLSKSTVTV